ncbi:Beta-phosphoglucomutase [Paenibacillus sp. P1XP2]|nr:Beta-phosphoglucomutase [Paenibacillus sp. P1XP2]
MTLHTPIRACLFDLDGVLVDTAKYHYLAWKRLAGELGFEFTEQDNERLKGVSRMASLDILLSIGASRPMTTPVWRSPKKRTAGMWITLPAWMNPKSFRARWTS